MVPLKVFLTEISGCTTGSEELVKTHLKVGEEEQRMSVSFKLVSVRNQPR